MTPKDDDGDDGSWQSTTFASLQKNIQVASGKKNDGDETSIGLDGLEGLSRAGNELGFKFRPDRHSSYPGSTYVDRQVMLSSAIRAFKLVRTKKKD